MIILRSKSFSSKKKKTDEETEYQKKERKKLAGAVGILAGGSAGAISAGHLQGKSLDKQTEVSKQALKHLKKAAEKGDAINEKITKRAEQLRNNPKFNNVTRAGIDAVEDLLKLENGSKVLEEFNKINKARTRLEKRVRKKYNKLTGAALLSSAALGAAAGLAANHGLKKQNKKVNRVRRHIED